ncbi:PREDICTED: taste receptor type 2 member 9-like, partial [Nanorana parkeri]|uniref:taste receptor type 2 member 9-like n=1 Tax=Nanorana parkeri TaxID=125878 RepID=UPI000854320E
MPELNPILAVVIHGSLFLSGLMGNMFILIVHFVDWWKTRELNPCDVIINCIVISNIALQGTILINEVCFFMFVVLYFQERVVNALAAAMSSLAFSSLWCSTCLCFYYCVKIINISGAFFYKLQAKLPVYMLFSSIAFTIVFITAGTIIASLCRHILRLKKNREGFSNAKVRSNLSAARTVTFLLILYLAFYGVLNAIFNETTG